MAPNGDQTLIASYSKTTNNKNTHKPQRLSLETLQRTVSDISLEITKESTITTTTTTTTNNNITHDPIIKLPPISELQDATCECCGMCEECTPEYISKVRDKYKGKLVCGLCAEAVKEEMEKKGGGIMKVEEALNEHMSYCVRFNRFGRTHPVLYQAEAMREMLKKSSSRERAKSVSPRDHKNKAAAGAGGGGIARSLSCIAAITKEIGSDRRRLD